MKKALLSALAVVVLVSITGCATAPNILQHATPTPTATIAPSATSATVLSSNGLSLTLSLNSTTYQYGDQITVTIEEKNTLERENNISASGNWPVFGYLGAGPCNTLNYPFGIALLQGYYDAESIASATPLQIYPIVFCPCELAVTSYTFQPSSGIASRYTLDGDWLSPISMNTDVTLTGVWDRIRMVPVNSSTGIAYQQATTNFTPGIYTLVGGDEWGALVIVYFSISNEASDDLVITPAGTTYRANVHEDGVTNPWPDVQTVSVNLSENISVEYRSYIETQAGETRNNIVFVRVTPINQFPNVGLTTNNMTAGIEINQSSGGGFPGNTEQVLTINILNDVEPGEYTFDIGLVIDGQDYGQLPCTINVIN